MKTTPKRILSVLLTLLLALAVLSLTTSAIEKNSNTGLIPNTVRKATLQTSSYILGNINSDGKVNAIDARFVLQASSGARTLDETQNLAADVNHDGKVNAVDARWILQVASGARTLNGGTTDPTPDPDPPVPDKNGNVSVGENPDGDRDAVIIW